MVSCPCCGAEDFERVLIDDLGDPVGCDCCLDFDFVYEADDRRCPSCGAGVDDGIDEFFIRDGKIVGCDRCLKAADPFEYVAHVRGYWKALDFFRDEADADIRV